MTNPYSSVQYAEHTIAFYPADMVGWVSYEILDGPARASSTGIDFPSYRHALLRAFDDIDRVIFAGEVKLAEDRKLVSDAR